MGLQRAADRVGGAAGPPLDHALEVAFGEFRQRGPGSEGKRRDGAEYDAFHASSP
jgi:hypothetical protein